MMLSKTVARAKPSNRYRRNAACPVLFMLVPLYVLFHATPGWHRIRQAFSMSSAAHSSIFTDHHGLIPDLVYFNDPAIVTRLGCPVGGDEIHSQYTCLYHFTKLGPVLSSLQIPYGAKQDHVCQSTHHPLPADWGRVWCIRSGQKPSWLDKELPSPWPVRGPTLMMGQMLGSNPTHQLNLHFYHIFRWMQQAKIPPRELDMIFDGKDEQHTLGTYGAGLADALAHKHGMLQDLPDVTVFKAVKLSIGGGFQFDMNLFQTDSPILCDYLRMAAVIKQHYGITSVTAQEANPQHVVIAIRKDTESRRLANAHELAKSMRSKGWIVSLATFGDMTFEAQLRMLVNATVLVGVSGSDLVSLLFMPLKAVVVEIFPLVLGVPVFCPELANQARNCGKLHRPYYSPYNATLFNDPETGQPIDARPIHQTKLVQVHIPGIIAHIQGAVQASDALMLYGFTVDMDSQGLITTCKHDHLVPQGMLYNCRGPDC